MLIKALFCFLGIAVCGSSLSSLNYHFFSIMNSLGLNLSIFVGLLSDCKRLELTVHFDPNWW